jgi:hypothetical protein
MVLWTASVIPIATLACLAASLSPKAAHEFRDYVRAAESRIQARYNGSSFLWAADQSDRMNRLRRGEILTERVETPVIDGGLLHHWIGAVFIPGVTLQQVTSIDRSYSRHKELYKPDVVESRTLSQDGNHYRIYMRLKKTHGPITAVLDTEHDVVYQSLDEKRMWSHSASTSVREVRDAGGSNERVLPPGEGFGFLWAIHSYWRLEQRDGGVYAECDAVSLSRALPLGMSKVFDPVIRTLSAGSLEKTLEAKRRAMLSGR